MKAIRCDSGNPFEVLRSFVTKNPDFLPVSMIMDIGYASTLVTINKLEDIDGIEAFQQKMRETDPVRDALGMAMKASQPNTVYSSDLKLLVKNGKFV
jgi:hypothetical protein